MTAFFLHHLSLQEWGRSWSKWKWRGEACEDWEGGSERLPGGNLSHGALSLLNSLSTRARGVLSSLKKGSRPVANVGCRCCRLNNPGGNFRQRPCRQRKHLA